jgi:hypothetical protein
MGYDVHIIRAAEWSESEATPITLEEWLAYVAPDPEMRLDGFAEARTPDGRVIRVEGAGLSVWTAWPGEGEGDNHAWMDYRRGRIVVKNPDPAILTKMCAIAERLTAKVQGDDGESYPEASDGQEDDTGDSSSEPKFPWWKRLLWR